MQDVPQATGAGVSDARRVSGETGSRALTKRRRVVFVFDERSLVSIEELRSRGFEFDEVPLMQGRVLLVPKLRRE